MELQVKASGLWAWGARMELRRDRAGPTHPVRRHIRP